MPSEDKSPDQSADGIAEQIDSSKAAAPSVPENPGPVAAPPQADAPAVESSSEAPRRAAETTPIARDSQPGVVRQQSDSRVEREMRRRTRRAFVVGGAAALAGLGVRHWLITRRDENGVPWPLRRTLEVNEEFARDYFSPKHLAATFPPSRAGELKQNGDEGMDDDFDPSDWQLEVVGLNDPSAFQTPDSASPSSDSGGDDSQSDSSQASGDDDDDDDDDDTDSGGSDSVFLSLDDIKSLPRVELIAEFKCIEGWSQIVQWAGARFIDFAAKYGPATRDGNPPDVLKNPRNLVRYVSLETPGAGYYVGFDMASALHPQTLLCYEMNGKPLTLEHGAPLRLITPVKYGIKSIKRIGTIRFTDTRPADFWAEQGYDWYAGL